MSFLRSTVVVVVLIAVIGGLGFFKFSQITSAIAVAESYPEHSESVEAITAAFTAFVPTLQMSGEVVVPNRVVLQSQRSGQIVQVGFQPGEAVEAGQLLVQLDISEEEARLKGARAEAELARLGLERSEKLLQSGNANRARLDAAQATYDMATSAVAVIEQSIAEKTIRAPFGGLTDPGNLKVGQFLTSGSEVTQITDQGETVWVDFRLPQFLGTLPVGAGIAVSANQHDTLQGEVVSRDAGIAAVSRTQLYRVSVTGPHEALAHGAYVEVTVPTGDILNVADLPVTALQSDAYGQFVNLLEPAETEGTYRAVRRDVYGVHYQGERVLIEGGLEQGLLIATDGSFKLYPGVLTYVVDELPDASSNDNSW
ncbi:hypothetical protein RA19_18570 [Leisingera sp. ANG-M1]|uniref:efflux RND transporter periplasmic adaptor subunit n=1 Tax=Leisingera sp. ANG-M1 TaxID=1577895 RepID=UPI00057ED5FE|nr:efflux RND transporter periplasmic adaptor subunit [Leisingera sp. ANG-M1]KIC08858.1 hypothetical protein RA19_18570 [Leisingera sp. ANG-M1]